MRFASPAARYAFGSGLVSIAGGLVVALTALTGDASTTRWAGLGWLVMVVAGVAGGTWAAAVHGRPGSDFIIALGTCILARLIASAAGAAAAAASGMAAVWPYLMGLGLGFVPLQVFEVGWFLRRVKSES